MLDSLSEMARALSGPGPGSGIVRSPPAVAMRAPLKGIDEEVPAAAHRFAVCDSNPKFGGRATASVEVPLPAGMEGVDVELGDRLLRLARPGQPDTTFTLPFAVDKGATKAKFSKSKTALTVTVVASP